MALQKDYDFNGIPVTNAYIRIYHNEGSKLKQTIRLSYHATPTSDRFHEEQYIFTPDLTGGTDGTGANFIKQGYDCLKAIHTFPISTIVDGQTIKVAGDVTAAVTLEAPHEIIISGSTSNDGKKIATSATFDGTDTTLTLSTVTDDVTGPADGDVKIGRITPFTDYFSDATDILE